MQIPAKNLKPVEDGITRVLFLLDDLKKLCETTADHGTGDAVDLAFVGICKVQGRLSDHASELPGYWGPS